MLAPRLACLALRIHEGCDAVRTRCHTHRLPTSTRMLQERQAYEQAQRTRDAVGSEHDEGHGDDALETRETNGQNQRDDSEKPAPRPHQRKDNGSPSTARINDTPQQEGRDAECECQRPER